MKRTPIPFTPALEDDLVEFERLNGHLPRRLAYYRAREKVLFLHSFAIYRWCRAVLRWWKNPPQEPVVFGELKSQGRRFESEF